jgi:hypothetical protein
VFQELALSLASEKDRQEKERERERERARERENKKKESGTSLKREKRESVRESMIKNDRLSASARQKEKHN